MRESMYSLPPEAMQSAAVLGFGRSGRAVTDFLLERHVIPTVYTQAPAEQELVHSYEKRGVRFVQGFPCEFTESVLFRSPGIRPDLLCIRRALAAGSILSGEADLFLQNTAATVIGVTGSDGKTTTSSLIAALLRASGKKAVLGGNNGTPLLPYLGTLTSEDYAVVELSSFQLMTTPAPQVAVLTNLTPNHLNWHTDYVEYAMAKCRILSTAKRLVTNADCYATREIGMRTPVPVTWFTAKSELPFPLTDAAFCVTVSGDTVHITEGSGCRSLPAFLDFSLPGRHNRENFVAAVGAVLGLVSDDAVLQTARSFRGVKHRLEYVATVRGVRYINSSIDTSPSRTLAALAALEHAPLVIAGGRGKGLSLSPLADALSERARAVFLYGETAEEIHDAIAGRIPSRRCESFTAAFCAAADAAREGDTVLLSPGCTAFDAFRDFEERGEVFCRLVKELAEERK